MYCYVDPKRGEAFAKTGATLLPLPASAQQTLVAVSGNEVPTKTRTPAPPTKPARGYTPRDTKKQPIDEPLCPHCNGPVIRVRRRFVDRLVSLLMPVQRYRCRMKGWGCDWEGIL